MAYEGFEGLKQKLSQEKGVDDPGAVAASIGRKKYGNAKMAEASSFGRMNPAKKPLLKP